MHAHKSLVIPCLILLFVLVFLASCSGYDNKRGRGDAPVGHIDDSPARITNFPDDFANIAFKCDGTTGIYVTTRDAPPVIVSRDPHCSTN